MRRVPEPFQAPPSGVGPTRLLVWLVARQWTTVVQGVACDVVWLLGLALTPWAIGRVVDDGLVAGDTGAFLGWLGVVVWLQLQHSLIQGLRDRAGALNFWRAEARLNQLLAHASGRVTVAADRHLPPGAVVTMASESWRVCFLPINVGSLVSALVAFGTVAVLLLRDSLLLGVLVLVGVPAFSALSFVLVKTLRARQEAAWDVREQMNTLAMDSVKGLRVLHGIGGQARFLARFREASASVRDAGRRVAGPLAAAEGLALLIAGTLVAALTWVGAVLVAQGELQIGALVAFYGYAGFLILPVDLINQSMANGVSAWVAARRIVGLLDVEPLWPRDGDETDAPTADAVPDAVLVEDTATGLRVCAGESLGIVVPDENEARDLVARLARLRPDGEDDVRRRGVRLRDLPIREVRSRIVACDAVPFLFSGTLREVLDPWGRHDDDDILRAVTAVDVGDVVLALSDGLDTLVGERGVEFSGGQRQRLGSARALLAEAELLVLHDPTSSVDAPTEERMAVGILTYRAGQATAIVTTSPLVLNRVDRVALVVAGAAVAEGSHATLLDSVERYRATVLRAGAAR